MAIVRKACKNFSNFLPFFLLRWFAWICVKITDPKNSFRILSFAMRRQLRLELTSTPPLILPNGRDSLISVIIPTYNRAHSLERLLRALSKQALSQNNFEVIVIDNASVDNTSQVCQQYASSFKNFCMYFEATPGLLAGRHAGCRVANGNILTFCDDDIEPSTEWLGSILRIMYNKLDVTLLGGNNKGVYEDDIPSWFSKLWMTVEKDIKINVYYSLLENIRHDMESPDKNYVFGCNYTVRREIIGAAGGFGPDSMESVVWQGDGENRVSSVAAEMGKVWLSPTVSVLHHMPKSRLSKEYLRKRAIFLGGYEGYIALRYGHYGVTALEEKFPGDFFAELSSLKISTKMQYLKVALKSTALRDWIGLPSYWGHEQPPQLLDTLHADLLSRQGW